MENSFYSSLSQYLSTRDTNNANRVVMQELGNILIKNREDFITLLKYADIPVSDNELDADLIDKFIANINNRKLMVGAAFLVNKHNRSVGFDGEEVISDTGVKAVHKVMFNYFDAAEEEQSNAIGGAWAGAIDSVAKLGGGIVSQQRSKKQGATDALYKKQEAKDAMVQAVLAQRAQQKEAAIKAAADKAKNQRILILAGVGVLVVGAIITGIIIYKRRKK